MSVETPHDAQVKQSLAGEVVEEATAAYQEPDIFLPSRRAADRTHMFVHAGQCTRRPGWREERRLTAPGQRGSIAYANVPRGSDRVLGRGVRDGVRPCSGKVFDGDHRLVGEGRRSAMPSRQGATINEEDTWRWPILAQ